MALEEKQFCLSIFLDVSQAFDRIWIKGLSHKISQNISAQHVQILTSYLRDRTFYVHYEEAKSRDKSITAGLPQGGVLGPLLYLMCTADIPTLSDTTLARFADDFTVISPHANYNVATSRLQVAVTETVNWTTRWKIKMNTGKTVQVDFAH